LIIVYYRHKVKENSGGWACVLVFTLLLALFRVLKYLLNSYLHFINNPFQPAKMLSNKTGLFYQEILPLQKFYSQVSNYAK